MTHFCTIIKYNECNFVISLPDDGQGLTKTSWWRIIWVWTYL